MGEKNASIDSCATPRSQQSFLLTPGKAMKSRNSSKRSTTTTANSRRTTQHKSEGSNTKTRVRRRHSTSRIPESSMTELASSSKAHVLGTHTEPSEDTPNSRALDKDRRKSVHPT